jgi:hypothetical protein
MPCAGSCSSCFFVGIALPTFARNEPKVEKVTVEQLEQALAATQAPIKATSPRLPD